LLEGNEIPASELILEARRLIGVRFLHQGREIGSGVDCIGLFAAVFTLRGIDLAKELGVTGKVSYGREPSPLLLEATNRSCRRLQTLRPGALLLFKMRGAKYPHHTAIYTDTRTFIHADGARKNVVIEQTLGAPWTRFLHSIWAVPGVAYPEDATS